MHYAIQYRSTNTSIGYDEKNLSSCDQQHASLTTRAQRAMPLSVTALQTSLTTRAERALPLSVTALQSVVRARRWFVERVARVHRRRPFFGAAP